MARYSLPHLELGNMRRERERWEDGEPLGVDVLRYSLGFYLKRLRLNEGCYAGHMVGWALDQLGGLGSAW